VANYRIISDRDNGFDAFFAGLNQLRRGPRAKVGIQGAEASSIHPGGISMVRLGAVHEFGATIPNAFGKGFTVEIPQRSFLRSTADQNKRRYENQMAKSIKKLVRTPLAFNAIAELRKVGETFRRDVLNRVRRGQITQDLSEITKARRGEEGPALWDTGMLMGSIRAVVE
jgi:phage gpG-like protein